MHAATAEDIGRHNNLWVSCGSDRSQHMMHNRIPLSSLIANRLEDLAGANVIPACVRATCCSVINALDVQYQADLGNGLFEYMSDDKLGTHDNGWEYV